MFFEALFRAGLGLEGLQALLPMCCTRKLFSDVRLQMI
jgi:hypothetical protein